MTIIYWIQSVIEKILWMQWSSKKSIAQKSNPFINTIAKESADSSFYQSFFRISQIVWYILWKNCFALAIISNYWNSNYSHKLLCRLVNICCKLSCKYFNFTFCLKSKVSWVPVNSKMANAFWIFQKAIYIQQNTIHLIIKFLIFQTYFN